MFFLSLYDNTNGTEATYFITFLFFIEVRIIYFVLNLKTHEVCIVLAVKQ